MSSIAKIKQLEEHFVQILALSNQKDISKHYYSIEFIKNYANIFQIDIFSKNSQTFLIYSYQ